MDGAGGTEGDCREADANGSWRAVIADSDGRDGGGRCVGGGGDGADTRGGAAGVVTVLSRVMRMLVLWLVMSIVMVKPMVEEATMVVFW